MSLTSLLEKEESISSLLYSTKHDRLVPSGALRLNIPPNYDKYMEWGFTDGSVRFYTADSKKVSIFPKRREVQSNTYSSLVYPNICTKANSLLQSSPTHEP